MFSGLHIFEKKPTHPIRNWSLVNQRTNKTKSVTGRKKTVVRRAVSLKPSQCRQEGFGASRVLCVREVLRRGVGSGGARLLRRPRSSMSFMCVWCLASWDTGLDERHRSAVCCAGDAGPRLAPSMVFYCCCLRRCITPPAMHGVSPPSSNLLPESNRGMVPTSCLYCRAYAHSLSF
jgi:hypothetical protein